MLTDIAVRQADINEIDKLMKWRMEVLRHVFAVPVSDDMRDLYAANLAYYKTALPSGEHIAVFAEMSGVTVSCGGLCLHREMPSPDNPGGQCAYLMNIYTREEYRGRGAGKAVVGYLVDHARERGITKIYLETSESGRPLYERLGFRDMRDYMKL